MIKKYTRTPVNMALCLQKAPKFACGSGCQKDCNLGIIVSGGRRVIRNWTPGHNCRYMDGCNSYSVNCGTWLGVCTGVHFVHFHVACFS